MNITGRVSGILSTFGYLPDVFMFTMVGAWLDSNPGVAGYNMIFTYAAVMGALCMVIAGALYFICKRRKKDGAAA